VKAFVAEQYLSAVDAGAAARRARAAREASEQLILEGTQVRYVRSIFIPEDETCLHLYQAESVEAVRTAAARASLRLERVTEAIIDVGVSHDRPQRGGAV
jgi:hypothetical protein